MASIDNTNVDSEFEIFSMTCRVDHNLRRIYPVRYKNIKLSVHVFVSRTNDPSLASLYQYPGLACNIKLPKIAAGTKIQYIAFDNKKQLKIIKSKLDTKMYFSFHHYAKYFVFGQVPAFKRSIDGSCDGDDLQFNDIYAGGPIFDHKNRLISFVTNCFIDEPNICLFPVTSDSYRTQGMLCLDGDVYIFDSQDTLNCNLLFPRNKVDIYLLYNNKNVFINVIYNGREITSIQIKTLFAGNVLIN